MPFLLDTCVLSEFTRPKPAASVERWLANVPDAQQFVSVLTMGELERGVRRLAAGRRRQALEVWVEELRSRLAARILPIDLEVATAWGEICAHCEAKGRPLPVVDGLIGATAVVHGHQVVTRNGADIERSGATIVDPWEA